MQFTTLVHERKLVYNKGVACKYLPAELIMKMHEAPGAWCMRYPEADTFMKGVICVED